MKSSPPTRFFPPFHGGMWGELPTRGHIALSKGPWQETAWLLFHQAPFARIERSPLSSLAWLVDKVGGRSWGRLGQEAAMAYGIFQQGEQHGTTLQGLLQGAVAGYEVGGPIGALVGAGLDLLGGLFHHPHLPPVQTQNLAELFGTTGFDYLAYRYKLYHTLGPVGPLGALPASAYRLANQFMQPAPTVNVYVDGVKTAVQRQLSSATSLASGSRTNVYYDATRPI